MLLDDRQLNKIVGMKHLRPYKHLDDDGNELADERKRKGPNEWKVKKIKSQYRDEIEQKKKLIRENQLTALQIEKE